MKNETCGENFLNKSPRSALKQLQNEKREFVNENVLLRSLSIQNREGFRQVYNSAKAGNQVEMQAFLSPMYNSDNSLSIDPDYFNKVFSGRESRIQSKVILSTDIIKYMRNYFDFKINFVIADKGLLLDKGSYEDMNDVDEKVNKSIDIFKTQITKLLGDDNFTISKLSDTDVDIERVRNMDFEASEQDCIDLIEEKALYPDNITKGLGDIKTMYGTTTAYYEIDAYFKESEYIGDNFKNNIILNIEGSSLGNKKLIKGKNNMSLGRENGNGGNVLIGGVIR